MTNDCCTEDNAKLVKRAREGTGWPEEWATEQIFECRECGRRWLG